MLALKSVKKHHPPLCSPLDCLHCFIYNRLQTEFYGHQKFPRTQILSGYILMSLLSGYQLVNVIFPFHLTSGSTGTWLIYYVFKLALYAIAGFFTAPFTITWNIYKLVRTTRLKI